jgi:hypothetical protein
LCTSLSDLGVYDAPSLYRDNVVSLLLRAPLRVGGMTVMAVFGFRLSRHSFSNKLLCFFNIPLAFNHTVHVASVGLF